MKKWTKILLIIVIVILLLLVGMSYFIGTQVFMGSTQLVTCEDTSKVKDSFGKDIIWIMMFSAVHIL